MFFWAESLGSSQIEDVSPSTQKVVHALIRRQHFPDREFHDSVFEVVENIDANDTASAMLADQFTAEVAVTGRSAPCVAGAIADASSRRGGSDGSELGWSATTGIRSKVILCMSSSRSPQATSTMSRGATRFRGEQVLEALINKFRLFREAVGLWSTGLTDPVNDP